MGLVDGLVKDGIGAVGTAIGGLAKDIRTAITGKEAITAAEREKIIEYTAKLEQAALDADRAINEGQMKINEIEAASPSFFKSGWRPATAWMCLTGFAYMTIIRPIVPWTLQLFHQNVPAMPSIDISVLSQLLIGLLGLSVMRSVDKKNGVS